MKRLLLFFSLLLAMSLAGRSQNVTWSFSGEPLPQALRKLSELSKDYTIQFIYDDLEDYIVTSSIRNQSLPDAVRTVVGFYPIRVSVNDETHTISVECLQPSAAKVTGHVVDESGAPLAYANIALLDAADSTFISGGVSNAGGDFVIPVTSLPVFVRVSFVGYKAYSASNSTGRVGTVVLEADHVELETVSIRGEQFILKAEDGMLTYDMPRLLQRIPADNAYDALLRIPGIYESEGHIHFGGRPSTLVINGKPTLLSEEQIIERLKMIPSEQVERAEVIMSAPPRFHANGLVVNVVTKDNTGTNQLSGQLRESATHSHYGLSKSQASLIYSRGPVAFDAQYTFTDGSTYQDARHFGEHPLGTERVLYEDHVESRVDQLRHDVRVGMEYAVADAHRLELAYSGRRQQSTITNTTTGTAPALQHTDQRYDMDNVDLGYSLPFGLTLNASYINYRNPRTQQLQGTLFSTSRDLSTDTRQNIVEWLLTADQSHSLSHGWGLSYGLKARFSTNDSYQTTTDAGGHLLPDATSSVDYDERTLRAYAGVRKQLAALSLDASVSLEQYRAPQWNDLRFFPSLNAMWKMDETDILFFSFSSDAAYPSYWSIMNSIYYSSTYTEIWGTPELRPSRSYDLDLMWQHGQNYSFGAFASFNPDFFVQLAYQPSDRMAVVMKEVNFDHRNQFGLMATAQFRAGSWLNGNVTAIGYYLEDKCDTFFDLPFCRHKIGFRLLGTASCQLSKPAHLTFIVNPVYQHNTIQGLFDIGPLLTLGSSLRWQSPSGRWSATLSGENLTNQYFKVSSTMANQHFVMHTSMMAPAVTLTGIYRFGNYKEKQRKQADLSRMGH